MPIEKPPLTNARESFKGLKIAYEFIKQTGDPDLIKIAEDELKAVTQNMRTATEKLMKAHKGELDEEAPPVEDQAVVEVYEPPMYEKPVLDKFREITGCDVPVSPHDQLFLVLVHEMLAEGNALSEAEMIGRAKLKKCLGDVYKIPTMVQNRGKYEVLRTHEAQLISDTPTEDADAKTVLKKITGINSEPEIKCEWQLLLWELAKLSPGGSRSLSMPELTRRFGELYPELYTHHEDGSGLRSVVYNAMTTAKSNVTRARKKFGSPYKLEENAMYKLIEKRSNQ